MFTEATLSPHFANHFAAESIAILISLSKFALSTMPLQRCAVIAMKPTR